jgi:two-component system, LytTR family, sensor kinase
MKYVHLTNKEKRIHLLYWSLITVFLCLVDPVPGNLLAQAVGTASVMFAYMFVYYVHYFFIYPRFYFNSKFKLAVSIITALILYFVISYWGLYLEKKWFENIPPVNSMINLFAIVSYMILFSIVSIMALGAYQNKISVFQIQLQSEKEKALLMKELGFFKNQFNSQTIFNFLKICQNTINSSSKESAEVIDTFATMLLYTVDTKPNAPVLLEKEIAYIQNFISLQKKLTTGTIVEFSLTGEVNNQCILPRILITFVENAFKHGVVTDLLNPIQISLKANDNYLIFEVKNKKSNNAILVSSGMGKNNAKNQLEHFYKDQYNLEVKNNDYNYTCKLTLNYIKN